MISLIIVWKDYYCDSWLPIPNVWESSSCWVIAQDALNQSDCMIRESAISHDWVIRVTNLLRLVKQSWKCPEYFKMIGNISSRWDMVKISLNMVHIIKRSYEITVVCLPLTTSAEQFNIFLRRKFTENLSLRTFQQKGPQKLCHLIFLKVVKKENCCDIWLPTPNSMSGIFLVLELSLDLL